MRQKLTQLQLENFVLERHEQGFTPDIISRLVLVNLGLKRNIRVIEKILFNYKRLQRSCTTGVVGKGKTFTDRIAARKRYNHTLEK